MTDQPTELSFFEKSIRHIILSNFYFELISLIILLLSAVTLDFSIIQENTWIIYIIVVHSLTPIASFIIGGCRYERTLPSISNLLYTLLLTCPFDIWGIVMSVGFIKNYSSANGGFIIYILISALIKSIILTIITLVLLYRPNYTLNMI